jgi:hypothetical protein
MVSIQVLAGAGGEVAPQVIRPTGPPVGRVDHAPTHTPPEEPIAGGRIEPCRAETDVVSASG